MRIIGDIPHPSMKITVFKHDNRISVKFETGLYEQVYKFRTGGLVNDLAEATQFVDGPFVTQVMDRFQEMHQQKTVRLGALQADSESFEEII